jgi:hypothetical protein
MSYHFMMTITTKVLCKGLAIDQNNPMDYHSHAPLNCDPSQPTQHLQEFGERGITGGMVVEQCFDHLNLKYECEES